MKLLRRLRALFRKATLDREIKNPNYRGARILGGLDYQSEHANGIFTMLVARGLVYDAVALPVLFEAQRRAACTSPPATSRASRSAS